MLGNPVMIVYSLTGGTLSLAAMGLLAGRRGVSPIGAGIAGGVLHNIGQVAVAMLILQTPSLVYYLGLLIPVGAGMGLLTGTIATVLTHKIPSLARLRKQEAEKE